MIPTIAPHTVVMSGIDWNGFAYGLSYPFSPTDAGRSTSRRPRQSNDCSVRAVALTCGLEYDAAYDLLADAGRRCARGFDIVTWLNAQPWAEHLSFQAVKGQRRMNPATFCERYTDDHYIIRTAKHVSAVINGILYDAHEMRPDRCIYRAWRVFPSASDLS